jgi:hypothetical protein
LVVERRAVLGVFLARQTDVGSNIEALLDPSPEGTEGGPILTKSLADNGDQTSIGFQTSQRLL